MTHTGRTAFALLLLVSGYLIALALTATMLAGALALVVSGVSVAGVLAVLVPAALMAGLVRLALRARRARDCILPEGLALAQTAQPRLWAEVFAVADRVSSRAPDEIWVVDRVAVELVEDTRALGLRPGPRRLLIGIPLMVGLSAEQLQAAIAHELAHDGSRQPRLRTTAYRGTAAVRRLRASLGTSITDRLLATMSRAFERITHPLVDAQELRADRIAADVVGSRTAIAALREIAPLDDAWNEFCEQYVLPAALVGQRPEDVFDGFVDFLDDDDRQAWMGAYAGRHPTGPPPVDGHPSLTTRIAALKEVTTSRQLDFSGAAEDILDRQAVVFEALEGVVSADSELRAGPFERVVPRGVAARVAAQIAALSDAARHVDQWPLDQEALLQMLRAGRASPLMRALAPHADGEQLDALAVNVVADLAAHRLVEDGRARFVMSWAHAPLLATRHGEELDPWSVAARATDSAGHLADFEEWLGNHGVALGRTSSPEITTSAARQSTPAERPARKAGRKQRERTPARATKAPKTKSSPRERLAPIFKKIAAPEPAVKVSVASAAPPSLIDMRGEIGPEPDFEAGAIDGAVDRAPEQPPEPTQRESLKSALKELDRLRQAQEAAEREAAEREAAEREAAEERAAVEREAAAVRAEAEGEAAAVSEAAPVVEDSEADDATPAGPSLTDTLAAAVEALADSSAEGGETDELELDPDAWDPQLPAAAFSAETPPSSAGPAPEELTGVLAAAAPIGGTSWATMVVSPVGISLRGVHLPEKLRFAKLRTTQGASLLSRAAALSVHELTSHRRTHTLSWADITRAEFTGLSEDKGVLSLYVGTRLAQRVEFLSTTEIHGDLLGALESLLGPRLRIS